MKRALILAAALIATTACADGVASRRAVLEAELMEVDRAFNTAAQADGAPAAFIAHMDPEHGMLVRPEGNVIGLEAIGKAYESWPEGARLEWEPLEASAAASGDLGYTWGEWAFYPPDAVEPLQTGRYVTIWRRDDAGRWKGVVDLGVENVSP